jgi:hypothetical protein
VNKSSFGRIPGAAAEAWGVARTGIVSLAIGLSALAVTYADAAVHVRGYFRKDGTYVAPHYRSSPDSSVLNNWSTKGNINPYTGEVGSKDASPSLNSANGVGEATSALTGSALATELTPDQKPEAPTGVSAGASPVDGPIPNVFVAILEGYSGDSPYSSISQPFFLMAFRENYYKCESRCPELKHVSKGVALKVFNSEEMITFRGLGGSAVACKVRACSKL